MHNTAHAQDSNSERACGGAEILTHLLLDVKETAQKVSEYRKRPLFLSSTTALSSVPEFPSEKDGKLV